MEEVPRDITSPNSHFIPFNHGFVHMSRTCNAQERYSLEIYIKFTKENFNQIVLNSA